MQSENERIMYKDEGVKYDKLNIICSWECQMKRDFSGYSAASEGRTGKHVRADAEHQRQEKFVCMTVEEDSR